MTLQLRNITLIIITWIFSIFNILGQQNNIFDKNLQKSISKVEFDKLVKSSALLLQTKEITDISNDQHIQIMMCLNTIFMARNADLQKRFKEDNYKKLKKIADEKKYDSDIIKVYPNWTFNRGMGYYFYALKMELYGTPRLYAWYHVDE